MNEKRAKTNATKWLEANGDVLASAMSENHIVEISWSRSGWKASASSQKHSIKLNSSKRFTIKEEKENEN